MGPFRLARVALSRVPGAMRTAHSQANSMPLRTPVQTEEPHALTDMVSRNLSVPKIPAHSSQFKRIESPMQFYKTLKASTC